jgi:hypothetical protein
MALTNVRREARGAHTLVFHADFAHTVGDAEETIVVPAGRVLRVQVNPLGTVNSQVAGKLNEFTTSVSNNLQTITFLATSGISAGTCTVEVALA